MGRVTPGGRGFEDWVTFIPRVSGIFVLLRSVVMRISGSRFQVPGSRF
jgi:hypothetical protein